MLGFLKEQCGAKHIGAVGFCWGGVATHYLALQYPEVKAGVSVYGRHLLHVSRLIVYGSKTAHTVWILYSGFIMGLCDAGIIREREDRYELKSPTLFIFGEKDEVIPLDQVSEHCPSRKKQMYTETFCRNPLKKTNKSFFFLFR